MHGYPGARMASLRQQWNARFLVVIMEEYPNYKFMITHGYGANEEEHRDDIWPTYFVPLAFTSGVLTADFWNVRYGAHGLRALMIPQALRQDRGYRKIDTWSGLKRCKLRYVGEDIKPELDQLRAVTRTWETSWKSLRPW